MREARFADAGRVQKLLAESDFDGIIAAWPENTAYLSGFYHPDMRLTWERLHIVVWPTSGTPVYIVPRVRADNWTTARSATWAAEEDRPFIGDIRGYDGEHDHMVELTAQVLGEKGMATGHVGIEARTAPFKLTSGLAKRSPHIRFGDAWPLLNEMRMVKTPSELQLITHVNQITARHLEAGLRSARPGETERAVGARITDSLFRDGAQELTHSIFGGGCRAGQWHPWPSGAALETGMLIRADWGIRVDGYCSDIARTAVVGRASRDQRTRFDRISAVHDIIVDAVRPGVVASELVHRARREYERLGEEFRWSIVGHGIGLVLHEEPQLTVEYDDPLVEGMTLQIELGWVDPTQGYHIEDLVHVGKDATVNLTTPLGTRTIIETGTDQ
jgi:Xaa-Pro aminopeptidase